MEHLDAFWSTLNTCPIGVNEEFVKLSVAISCHTLKQKEMHSNLAKQGNQAIMFGRTVWLELLSCPTSLSSTRRNLIQLNFPSAPSVHVVVYECIWCVGSLLLHQRVLMGICRESVQNPKITDPEVEPSSITHQPLWREFGIFWSSSTFFNTNRKP